MKILGIVTELNPLHNGHIYQIEQAKKKTKCDFVILLMSGNFTQSGNIAILDKFTRAKLAIQNGADIVIELPTIYANSSAQFFSSSAINILNSLKIIDYITFGNENTNISELKHIANTIIKNEDAIWQDIKVHLKNGDGFAKARQNALTNFLEENYIDILSKPNNILAIEYIKALKKLKSKIKIVSIPRTNDISATKIRNSILNKNQEFHKILNDIPQNEIKYLENISKFYEDYNDKIFELLKYKLLNMNIEDIKNINEVTEGLENRILKSAYFSTNYNEFLENLKSKRYTNSKLKRIVNNILLNIDKDTFNYSINNKIAYAHVLSISDNGKKLLSKLSKESKIDVLTSLSDTKLKSITPDISKMIKIDVLASNIYNIISKQKSNMDYTNKL